MKCRSGWQSPATEVRISTSRGPGFGRLTSSITSGLLTSCRTAAFIAVSSLLLFRHCERSEAIQFLDPQRLDCFVARAPRNDVALTLRGQKQFANLGHAGGAVAE